jgi:acyl carrier protein
MLRYVQQKLAKILNLSSAEQIEPRQRFFDLGLDSLIAIELKHDLEKNLGRTLPNTLLFDYPTLEALVDYLLADLDLSPKIVSQATVLPTLLPDSKAVLSVEMIKNLSEAEAERLLLAELTSLNY